MFIFTFFSSFSQSFASQSFAETNRMVTAGVFTAISLHRPVHCRVLPGKGGGGRFLPHSNEVCKGRASSSYFFLFFPIFLSILLFFLFFSNFLLFFLFFSHFTYNKQIFVRDLNILSLFKYVVNRVH